ncbi:D-lactaldehyde dehydrogenase [Lentinula aciculospora]|uniref:D-lactaldehyde dehydrogenase n=1 Tax=Lentinula aciculospora TaxID=153920 RepID=A0A9W9DU19_9AGAR|nr:D-lactaldehyde dehydrogenase [Lentinula aciculospora]
MPALDTTKNTTVLVTGANGFVATWVIDNLLQRGYSIRAAVRTEAKGQYLLEQFNSYGAKIELAVVGDIAKETAFDDAVKNVDGVVHTASPVHLGGGEPNEMIEPAVNGTLGILKSALKFGNNMKRIVITSSCAAVKESGLIKSGIDETNWNEASILECEQKGKNANPLAMYSASKTIAEKRAWEFVAEHTSERQWDLVVITPPWIFGPPLHEVTSLEALNSSNMYWYQAVFEGNYFGQNPENDPDHGWVDVRDTAEAHARALERPAAGGERIIVCAGSPWVWQDLRDVSKGIQPKIRSTGTTFNVTKEHRLLDLQYKSLKECTDDILAYIAKKGW